MKYLELTLAGDDADRGVKILIKPAWIRSIEKPREYREEYTRIELIGGSRLVGGCAQEWVKESPEEIAQMIMLLSKDESVTE